MNDSRKRRLEDMLETLASSAPKKKKSITLNRIELNCIHSFLRSMLDVCLIEPVADDLQERMDLIQENIGVLNEDNKGKPKDDKLKKAAKKLSKELLIDLKDIDDKSDTLPHPQIIIDNFFKGFDQDMLEHKHFKYTGSEAIVHPIEDIHHQLLISEDEDIPALAKSVQSLFAELLYDSKFEKLLDFSSCSSDKGLTISRKAIRIYRNLHQTAAYCLNEMIKCIIPNLEEAVSLLSLNQSQHRITFGIVEGLFQLSDSKVISEDVENTFQIEVKLKKCRIVLALPISSLGFDDRIIDVFDICLSLWTEFKISNIDEPIIHIDDLLRLRGVKSKNNTENYRIKDRDDIENMLSVLQSIKIYIENYQSYKNPKKPFSYKGKLFKFEPIFNEDKGFNHCYLIAFPDSVYEVFKIDKIPFWPVPESYYQFHPNKQKWERRIARYLIWQSRVQAAKRKNQSIKVKTILDKIHISPNFRHPLKISDKLDKALETLVDVGIIKEFINNFKIISKRTPNSYKGVYETANLEEENKPDYPVFTGETNWWKKWLQCTISFTWPDKITAVSESINKKRNQIIGGKKGFKSAREKKKKF